MRPPTAYKLRVKTNSAMQIEAVEANLGVQIYLDRENDLVVRGGDGVRLRIPGRLLLTAWQTDDVLGTVLQLVADGVHIARSRPDVLEPVEVEPTTYPPRVCPECGNGVWSGTDTEALEDFQDGGPPAHPDSPRRYPMGTMRRMVPGATTYRYSCGHSLPEMPDRPWGTP